MVKAGVRSWQIQEAKNRLSELVDEVARSGPQVITHRGASAAVVVSAAHWARLAQRRSPLIEVLRRAPRVQIWHSGWCSADQRVRVQGSTRVPRFARGQTAPTDMIARTRLQAVRSRRAVN